MKAARKNKRSNGEPRPTCEFADGPSRTILPSNSTHLPASCCRRAVRTVSLPEACFSTEARSGSTSATPRSWNTPAPSRRGCSMSDRGAYSIECRANERPGACCTQKRTTVTARQIRTNRCRRIVCGVLLRARFSRRERRQLHQRRVLYIRVILGWSSVL